MIIVEINQGDSIDKALKKLKTKVNKTRQNQQLYKRKEYIKKSVRKRLTKQKAIYSQKVKNSQCFR
jgi:small subunit ribosomal protein S21